MHYMFAKFIIGDENIRFENVENIISSELFLNNATTFLSWSSSCYCNYQIIVVVDTVEK